ncbi:MAG: NTP transferase domain-containing protein [Bacteroidetes bacterium]|nr:NTP transferase domain-containing protein [Bacteroidota bacterium]
MNIIIPMAGMGKRMRPHTLTVPKPLLPVGGKPIVQRLVEDITKVCGEKVNEIAFVISPFFGQETEKNLLAIAASQGAKGAIYYQEEALGTAHAVMCAQPALSGKTVVAFADTLFKADFVMDTQNDGAIWVQRIDDPRQFGVVKLNKEGFITDFVEKPQEFVSDLAIIGIYYFKDGAYLKNEIQYLLDNNIKDKGEFQLTNALENMKNKGTKFIPGKVSEWLDCGNKEATVYTNQRVLEFDKGKAFLRAASAKIENATIIEPCFIGEHAHIVNSVVGPHVSVGAHSHIQHSVVKNSIIQQHSSIQSALVANAMIGNYAQVQGKEQDINLGDYSILK